MHVFASLFPIPNAGENRDELKTIYGVVADGLSLHVVIHREALLVGRRIIKKIGSAFALCSRGSLIEVLKDETLFIHLVHRIEGFHRAFFGAHIAQGAVIFDVEPAIAGFAAADAEELEEAPEVGDALVGDFTREERNDDFVGIAGEGARVRFDAAEEGDEFVDVISSFATNEEFAPLAVCFAIGRVDVLAKGFDEFRAGLRGKGILLGDDVLRVLLGDGDLLGRLGAVGVIKDVDGRVDRFRGNRGVLLHVDRFAIKGGKITGVKKLLHPVFAEEEHLLDVVVAVEVRGIVDAAVRGVDDLPDGGVVFKELLEVRHHVEILREVQDGAVDDAGRLNLVGVALSDVDQYIAKLIAIGLKILETSLDVRLIVVGVSDGEV